MPESAPQPRSEMFLYLDVVVDMQKRVVTNMDQVARRLDEQSTELTRITRTLGSMREWQVGTTARLDELTIRLDQVDSRIDALQARFDSRIDALQANFDSRIDALQANFDSRIDALQANFDSRLGALDAKVDSRVGALDARIGSFATEVRAQFRAVGLRFEEVEHRIDQLSKELHDARIEIVSQNNATLNAAQAAFTIGIKLDDILDRVNAIEATLSRDNPSL